MLSARGRGRPRKDRASVALYGPSRATSMAPSGDDEVEGPSAPPGPSPGPSAGPSSQGPTPAASSVPKYTENDLQRILKTVLESRTPAAPRDSDEKRQRPLKARAPDVYKGKSHMDCYDFIQQCEDHFATSGARVSTEFPLLPPSLRNEPCSGGNNISEKSKPILWSPLCGTSSRPSYVGA